MPKPKFTLIQGGNKPKPRHAAIAKKVATGPSGPGNNLLKALETAAGAPRQELGGYSVARTARLVSEAVKKREAAAKQEVKRIDAEIRGGSAWQRGKALEEARAKGLKLNKAASGLAKMGPEEAEFRRRNTGVIRKDELERHAKAIRSEEQRAGGGGGGRGSGGGSGGQPRHPAGSPKGGQFAPKR
jgi:hypothetical protein